MPDVAIARYDASTGWLPPVCPKHGCRADRQISRKYSTPTQTWVYLLILVAVLVFVIVAATLRKSDDVAMPACRQCAEGAAKRGQIRWGTGLGSLGILVLAFVTTSSWLFLLAGLAFVGWLLCVSSMLDSMCGVAGSLDGPWLRLKGVHPAFIAALLPNPAWNRPQYVPIQQGYPAPAPYQQPFPR